MVFQLEPIKIDVVLDTGGLDKGLQSTLKSVRKAAAGIKKELNGAASDVKKSTTKIQKNFKKTGDASGGLLKNVKSLRRGFAALGAVVAAGIFVKITKGFVDAVSITEQLRIRLDVVLQSQRKANQAFEEFEELAARMPFTLKEIIDGGATLAAVAESSVRKLSVLTQAAANIAASTGLTLKQTSENLLRSLSSGIGAADLFRERGVRQIIEVLLEIDDLTKESLEEQGKAFLKVYGPGGILGNATDKLTNTVKGQFSLVSDAVFKFQRKVGEAIVDTGLLQETVDALIELFEDPDSIEGMSSAFSAFAQILKTDVLPELTALLKAISGISVFFGKRSILNELARIQGGPGQLGSIAKLEGLLEALRSGPTLFRPGFFLNAEERIEQIAELEKELLKLQKREEELIPVVERLNEGMSFSEAVGSSAAFKSARKAIRKLRDVDLKTVADAIKIREESLKIINGLAFDSAEERASLELQINEDLVSDTLDVKRAAKRKEDRLNTAQFAKLKTATANFLKDIATLEQNQRTETEQAVFEAVDAIRNQNEVAALLSQQEIARSNFLIQEKLAKKLAEISEKTTDKRIKDEERVAAAVNKNISALSSLASNLEEPFERVRAIILEIILNRRFGEFIGVDLFEPTKDNIREFAREAETQLDAIGRAFDRLLQRTAAAGDDPLKIKTALAELEFLLEKQERFIRLKVAVEESQPEFDKFFDNLGEGIDGAIESGLKSGFRSFLQSGDIMSFMANIGDNIIDTVLNSLIDAFIQAAGFKNLFQGLFADIGGTVGGIVGAVGSLFGGGDAEVTGMARGGLVPALPGASPFRDSVPALLTPGERVLTRDDNIKLERGVLGRETNQFNVTINANDAKSFEEMLGRNPRALEKFFVNSIRANSPVRNEIRQMR